MNTKEENHIKHKKVLVHHTLAHSYSVYLFLFLIGVVLDFFFPIKLAINTEIVSIIGFLILAGASFLILWAQNTSNKLDLKNEITALTFCKGPYYYTRTPTNYGLFFLVLGFSLVINALFLFVFTIIAFFITRFVFLRKQESILLEKYGEPYKEYQKKVRF